MPAMNCATSEPTHAAGEGDDVGAGQAMSRKMYTY